jgi:hypothetical protein
MTRVDVISPFATHVGRLAETVAGDASASEPATIRNAYYTASRFRHPVNPGCGIDARDR